MIWIEACAAMLGAVSVWLMTRQRPLAWPVGLAMVLLYIGVFYDARLYSEMLLQAVYAVLQGYGWWRWLSGRSAGQALAVTALPGSAVLRDLAAGLLITLSLGTLMSLWTNANLPWLDAALTGFSLVGQYWMANKRIQCWPLWLVLDVVYVGMFFVTGLYMTALLYLAFTGLAAYGWWQWRQPVAWQGVPA